MNRLQLSDPSDRHERRHFVVRAATAGVMTAVALSACSRGDTDSPRHFEITAAHLDTPTTAKRGANVRHDPAAIEDQGFGETNACGTLDHTVTFPETAIRFAENSDANGNWIGFDTRTTEGLPEGCLDDSDHTVWINETNFPAGYDISKTTVLAKD